MGSQPIGLAAFAVTGRWSVRGSRGSAARDARPRHRIRGRVIVDHALDREVALDAPASRVAHRLALRAGFEASVAMAVASDARPLVDEQPGLLIDDHFWIAANRGGNHRQRRRHRFQDRQRHAFVGRAVDVDIKCRHHRPDVAPMAGEMRDVADAKGVRAIDQGLALRPLANDDCPRSRTASASVTPAPRAARRDS